MGYSGQTILTEGPVLLSDRSGGVYESTGERFVQVADGRLVAADDQRALVETCDQRLRCESRWFDRQTWEPVDLGLPAGADRQWRFPERDGLAVAGRLRSVPGLSALQRRYLAS